MTLKNAMLGAALGGLLMAPVAYAQATPDRPAQKQRLRKAERMERRLAMMKQRLGLSDAQEQKIRAAFREKKEKMKQMRGQQSPRSDQARHARKQIRWEFEDQVHEILTCEQREAFRKMKREHRARRYRHGRRHGRGHHRGHRPAQSQSQSSSAQPAQGTATL